MSLLLLTVLTLVTFELIWLFEPGPVTEMLPIAGRVTKPLVAALEPRLLTPTEAEFMLVLVEKPEAAPPALVLPEVLAEPVLAPWLLVAVARSKLLFVRALLVVALVLTTLVEPGPVVLMSAAAKPVIRLRPITVVAAARISCFFIYNLPYLVYISL